MPDALAHFTSFMREYADFLDAMRRDEQERFDALRRKDLPRIESSIARSQANTMQLNNYETRRLAEQEKAGLAGLPFREMLEKLPEEQRPEFRQLLERFELAVSDIRFFNDKSMAVARDGMLALDPNAVLPGGKGGHAPSNPYQSIKETQAEEKTSVLETKI